MKRFAARSKRVSKGPYLPQSLPEASASASPAAATGGGTVARRSGGYQGTMGNWSPYPTSRQDLPRERALIARRAEDLTLNDPHAASLIGGMSVNSVGKGLSAQSKVDAKALGISEEQAQDVQDQAERAFAIWSAEADAGRRMSLEDIQFQAIHTAFSLGEYCYLCRMLKDPTRTFSFALRAVSPHRISTPMDYASDPNVHDGVRLGPEGEPIGYYFINPDPFTGRLDDYASSSRYVYNQARAAHRPVVLHGFPQAGPEQVRGVSVLSPAMKFFRDMSDCLDYNLVGQIVAAAFPMVVYSDTPEYMAAGQGQPLQPKDATDKTRYQEAPPGRILYLENGERLEPVATKNPPQTFTPFMQFVLRAASAAAGMPLEVATKDFSQTNYSSARAALLEAERALTRYVTWLSRALCQPCWDAVFEEAWLRGMIKLPKGSPGFYAARRHWTGCMWIPPKRGHVDPLKEMEANVLGLKSGILTYAEVIESGGGQWEQSFDQQTRERNMRRERGLPQAEEVGQGGGSSPASQPQEENAA